MSYGFDGGRNGSKFPYWVELFQCEMPEALLHQSLNIPSFTGTDDRKKLQEINPR